MERKSGNWGGGRTDRKKCIWEVTVTLWQILVDWVGGSVKCRRKEEYD